MTNRKPLFKSIIVFYFIYLTFDNRQFFISNNIIIVWKTDSNNNDNMWTKNTLYGTRFISSNDQGIVDIDIVNTY